MSEAIEAFDWSSTSLGPIEGWPLSLKSTLRMVLASKQTICFWWGPDLLSFYNDTYVPLLGKRADNALGRPFRDVWGDVWEAVLPFTQEALAGRGTWSEDLPLEMTRNGFLEQTYWTFSYSPLFDDEGKVAGVLNIVTETTRAVEDRQALKQSYAEAQQHIALLNQYRQQQLVLQNEISHRQKNTLSIIQAIIGMAKALALKTTAEGVETDPQRLFLRVCGCEYLQGYLFSRPVAPEAITQMLARVQTERRAV